MNCCGLRHCSFVGLSHTEGVVLFPAMYSTLDYLLSPRYIAHSPVYVISDSEMKQLELQEYQIELDSILDQRKRLDESYERQRKWLQERECTIQKDIKALSSSASEPLKNLAKKTAAGVKETVKKAVNSVPNV